MTSSNIPTLRRPDFFDGQRLTADDLGDVLAFHQELRWLHNRSLHNWGIVFGFAVQGAREDRKVTVAPGFALDRDGREIILTETVEIAVPAVAGDGQGNPKDYYLTASYATDEDLDAETRAGTCDTAGAVRRDEEPVIAWKDPSSQSYRHGYDVILASVQIQACKLYRDVNDSARRDALPAPQPYVASGMTSGDALRWDYYPDDSLPLGIKAAIPTNSAGFRNTPQYQAHVMGNRVVTLPGDEETGEEELTLVMDGFTHIASPTALNFEIRMFLPTVQPIRVGRFHTVSLGNLYDIVMRAITMMGFVPAEYLYNTLARTGFSLRVGEVIQVFVYNPFPTMVGIQVTSAAFVPTLNVIAGQYGVTVEELLAANGLALETLELTLNQRLTVPTTTDLSMNPAEIWADDNLLDKINQLDWSVVWMGVET